MGQLRVDRLDDVTLARLGNEAEKLDLSSEQLVRALILERFGSTGPERADRARKIRKMTPRRLGDSTPIIRRLRDAK